MHNAYHQLKLTGFFLIALLGLTTVALFLGLAFLTAPADAFSQNIESGRESLSTQGVISITDSDWTTYTQTSDCATGWGDDTWQLTLTQIRNVTIAVTDCCCPGDYYEVWVDGKLIGTTPNLAPPWGCDFSGPLSAGSFTVTLCPGTHTISVRDAGFDGHSLSEIQDQRMCPAGFTVSGVLSAPSTATAAPSEAMFVPSPAPLPTDPVVQQLQAQTEAVAPFIVTDERGMQRLLSDEARRAGVSAEALALGHRLVALNNRIVMAAIRDEEVSLDASDFAFIEPLFRHQAQAGSHCGSFRNPTPCPPRVQSGQFFSTEAEVMQHLISLGYHRTANYAGGSSGRDYTLVVDHPACGTGPFRIQANIRQQGPCWTYSTQGPEPNPEIRSYSWPHFWWGGYVAWWHAVYC